MKAVSANRSRELLKAKTGFLLDGVVRNVGPHFHNSPCFMVAWPNSVDGLSRSGFFTFRFPSGNSKRGLGRIPNQDSWPQFPGPPDVELKLHVTVRVRAIKKGTAN